MGYSLWGCKEWGTAEPLRTAQRDLGPAELTPLLHATPGFPVGVSEASLPPSRAVHPHLALAQSSSGPWAAWRWCTAGSW